MNRFEVKYPKIVMFLLMLLVNGSLYANDFELNGLIYRIMDNTNKIVRVTGKNNNYFGSITIPKTITYLGVSYTVTSIDDSSFYGDKDITSVSIPESIDFIDESAFSGCDNLDTVFIQNIESWLNIGFDNAHGNPLENANHLFINGFEVSDLVIPEGVRIIDDYAFYCFRGIKSLILPTTLEWIFLRAFDDCDNLELVVSKCITPPHLDTEYGHPFRGISPNAKLVVPEGCIDVYKNNKMSLYFNLNYSYPSTFRSDCPMPANSDGTEYACFV